MKIKVYNLDYIFNKQEKPYKLRKDGLYMKIGSRYQNVEPKCEIKGCLNDRNEK